MKLKVGDLVRFLNEKGEGTVSKMLNKNTVAVTIADGFEIPYPIAELLLIKEGPAAEAPIEDEVIEEVSGEFKQKISVSKSEQKGIYLAFAPENFEDIASSDINVWLINYTDYTILFSYSLLQNGSFETLETGTAASFESTLIETIDRKLLHDFSNFKIDALFYKQEEHQHQSPVSELVKLKPIKLYRQNAFTNNPFIPEKSLVMCVSTIGEITSKSNTSKVDFAKMLVKKEAGKNSSKISKPHLQNNPASEVEIDLHIEELIDNFSGMSNYEIVQVQVNSFKNALDNAVNNRCRKLIVIHGVGNGKLKQEIRAVLSKDTNFRFYDASYAKYGFGATEVVLS